LDILKAIVLGLVQGLSEFLPVSSSGHLIIVPYVLRWESFVQNLPFDVALHLGTAIALLAYFWRDWWRLVTSFFGRLGEGREGLLRDPDARLLLILLVGSIPAAIVGLLFESVVEERVRQPWVVGIMLVVFALVLAWAELRRRGHRRFEHLTFRDGLVIGAWQAISLVPGVSRSGSTITGGLLRGLDKETATRFSFLLATPAIVGAALLSAGDMISEGAGGDADIFVAGFVASVLSSFVVIRFMLAYIRRHDFRVFVVYRVMAGLAVVGLVLSGY
jgi:undecaprenyl-diphosphatase